MMSKSQAFSSFINRSDTVESSLLADKHATQSQVNVQVTASQGLEQIMSKVADALVMYSNKVKNGEQLSNSELEDYARQVLSLYVYYNCDDAATPTLTRTNGEKVSFNFEKDFSQFEVIREVWTREAYISVKSLNKKLVVPYTSHEKSRILESLKAVNENEFVEDNAY